MNKPVRLELNNSGSWKVLGRFDAADDDQASLVMDAAEDLIKTLHNSECPRRCPTMRVSSDDSLSTVLMRWSITEGWRAAKAPASPLKSIRPHGHNRSVNMTTTDTATLEAPQQNQAAPAVKTIMLAELPPLGQPLDDGTFAGLITTKAGTHCAVVLLSAKPAKRLRWDNATAWAASLDAQLPSRPVAALLYANLKPQLEATWHWTSDELQDDTGDADEASFAWYCSFFDGYQNYYRKSAEGAAVAVRLIPLSA